MMRHLNYNDIFIMGILIAFIVVMRLLPHSMGVTPVGAAGLFAGAYLPSQRAWLVPVIALFISDIFIGLYTPIVMLSVYIGMVLSVCIGRILLLRIRTVWRLATATLLSGLIFFVISNFGVWLSGLYYSFTFFGLLECYTNAIPFLKRGLLGDALYVTILFSGYKLFQIISVKWQLYHRQTSA